MMHEEINENLDQPLLRLIQFRDDIVEEIVEGFVFLLFFYGIVKDFQHSQAEGKFDRLSLNLI